MSHHRRRLTTSLALLTFLMLMLPAGSSASSPPLVVVIVADGHSLTNVSKAELRRLFLRNTKEIDGQTLVPLNHPPGTNMRVAFDRLVLGMEEAEVGRYWIDRRIRGESGPPRTVGPPPLLRKVVSRLPGAISYVRADEVDDSVQVLRIDGKVPSDPGYPLK